MRLTSGVNSIFAEQERRVTADLESGFLVAKSTAGQAAAAMLVEIKKARSPFGSRAFLFL
jgi:hypothetical protein